MKEKKKERKGRNEIDSYYVIYSSMRAAAAAVGNTTHTTNTHTTTMLTHLSFHVPSERLYLGRVDTVIRQCGDGLPHYVHI